MGTKTEIPAKKREHPTVMDFLVMPEDFDANTHLETIEVHVAKKSSWGDRPFEGHFTGL